MSETPQYGSHAQGDDKLQKQASQLAYDVKYKVKQKLGKDSKLSPAQVSKAYMAQLAASPAPAAVKALAKKKLMGEEHTLYVKGAARELVFETLTKVFIEGIEEVEEEVVSESDEKTYKIRVTDKATGNTYVRTATRAKIAELRANKNISSVEMTGYGKPIESERTKGKQTAAAKAGKDYDGDGKVESPSKEHAGAVHNAIQRKKGGIPDGKDTRKEEVIYETEEKDGEKKITGKGVNNAKLIKIMPNLGEQAPVQTATEDPREKQLANQKLSNLKRLQMKKQQLERQKLNLQKQGKLPMGEETCSSCGGKGCEKCEKKGGDERAKPTEMSLIKNKMRARGIQVAGLDIAPRNMKTADELGEARNAYAVGMAAAMKQTGDTPPLEKSTIKKAHKIAKAINREEVEHVDEGLSGERYKEALKKGKMYSRKVSEDPSKRAKRGGRGGESDFGAGDRGSGNKAARRAGTYQEEEFQIDEARRGAPAAGKEEKGKEVAKKRSLARTPFLADKFRKEHPGSRQEKKVKGAKETESEAQSRRINRQVARVVKHGHTAKEKKESQARSKYDSARD